MLNKTKEFKNFSQDGLELTIDIKTGEVFATQSAIARMCQKGESTLRYFITSQVISVVSAEVNTSTGFKTSQLLDEDGIVTSLTKYNPNSLANFVKLGLRIVLHEAVGYKHNSTSISNNVQRVGLNTTEIMTYAPTRTVLRSVVGVCQKTANQLKEYNLTKTMRESN